MPAVIEPASSGPVPPTMTSGPPVASSHEHCSDRLPPCVACAHPDSRCNHAVAPGLIESGVPCAPSPGHHHATDTRPSHQGQGIPRRCCSPRAELELISRLDAAILGQHICCNMAVEDRTIPAHLSSLRNLVSTFIRRLIHLDAVHSPPTFADRC
ncbi:hypothetical protein CC85DRAFT_195136 [Cutaneotrichosporon oleaginosum]|uniref:Uncharacterized protein n=1 Tax=Cutaneotrichosporon oleaginosum TaxID=879819 RepID=A0A0J0XEF2_9TREE|nr:uncharacterized protein CC85DRAFT_195136 [Cutaneotrichosporon oleaginosum]KLT39450.1 hypothetical protein CC85DRAFT_195136 [Cutaneotrichosporon oleaginosum]TXT09957.1 hypothetical protein COLE_03891 [Cutaneotrichosporon oleaginosum]